jgi:hypothetical protein
MPSSSSANEIRRGSWSGCSKLNAQHIAHAPQPVPPFLDRDIAAAEPGEREQLLQFVVVLVAKEAPQLLARGIVGVVLDSRETSPCFDLHQPAPAGREFRGGS